MGDRRIFIIWNPFTGGQSAKITKTLKSILDKEGISYQVFDTKESKSASISVRDNLDDSFTDMIVVGGDGTINEAINGLSFDIPVSIIPAGTGDDFIKNVHIGKSLEDKIQTAIHGEIKEIDLGQCNDRKFVNGVGIGFDGQIVEDMASKRVPLLKGHAAYYYHVLRILGGYKERSFQFEIGNKSFTKELILLTVGNGTTFGGGFKLMPEAKIDDGLLEICEIGKVSGLRRFLNVGKLSGGTHGSMPEVSFNKASSVKIEKNDSLFAHIDGERMGQPPFEIKVLPKALKLRVSSS